MKSFFDENHRFTPEAEALDRELDKVIRPIFDKYVKLGYSPREISHILTLAALMSECEAILTKES